MWKKIKEILCKHTASKDETTIKSITDTMTASVIDLGPSLPTSLVPTEMRHHQAYYKLHGRNTLNKTNEHCRSLFNLLPTSLRPRRTSNEKNDVNASIVTTTVATTTKQSPSIDIVESGYMPHSLLNRTSSYASCYSAVASTTPRLSLSRYGSIENLLHGHSKSHPANIHVLVRKNFQSFSQAHLAVTKGTIVTALFSRGPWLYVRINSNGKTGYIPRIICSLYQHHIQIKDSFMSSSDSTSLKDATELELTKMPLKYEKYSLNTYKKPIHRYLSHSSAIINDSKQRISHHGFDRRDTYTLPRQPRNKERRLTLNSIHSPANEYFPTRDTDSSSTQDSGYSDSTPFFLVQQITPEKEQISSQSIIHSSKTSTLHYSASNRRSTHLKIPDSINPSQPHSIVNGTTMNENSKRHSFGLFETPNGSKTSTNHSIHRLLEFALIRNVRQDKVPSTTIHNLPKSHIQIPASIFLNHHRQKQQFGSSHSAFRPVQPSAKHKRASSEGHSPSISTTASSSSSSSSVISSNTSLNVQSNPTQRRRLSCDLPIPILSKPHSNSLTRSVCDQSSPTRKINQFSRTMSEILCDQFSEINLDAIEKDSLIYHRPKKFPLSSQQGRYTILKDYRSSRASFAVKRGDYVDVLKQIGRASCLVRKYPTGQMGFLPKTLLIPVTSTKVDTFLEMHGYRETII